MAGVGSQVLSYFEGKGLSPAAAAGIVGNMQQESSLNPNSPGGGLIQGQGGRTSSGSLRQQLDGVWHELNTGYRGALESLKAAKTPQEAARAFSTQFEKPGEPMLSNRERYAVEAAGGKLTGPSSVSLPAATVVGAAARSIAPGTEHVETANPKAKGLELLSSMLANEKGGSENPLLTTGVLANAAAPTLSTRTIPGSSAAGGAVGVSAGLPGASPNTPVGQAPASSLGRVTPPVKVALPGYITGKGFPAVERAKAALERASHHPVSVPELRKEVNEGAKAPHAVVQTPGGDVHQTSKGPVYVPKKRNSLEALTGTREVGR